MFVHCIEPCLKSVCAPDNICITTTLCPTKSSPVPIVTGEPGMALYLTFPVTMFWISNQPEYFEEYIVKRKREIYPPEQDEQKRQLQEMKEAIRLKNEKLYMQD
ncbi:protein PET100 homolog, mitochondrial [Anomaloglossus baeobatrachus]|uniref:protein PET100 homolog, mitochondrial isoform X1 n=1 Tax=Anomaloglossus baeobatrachus TaxID=238106 RepID=UPI003F4F602C